MMKNELKFKPSWTFALQMTLLYGSLLFQNCDDSAKEMTKLKKLPNIVLIMADDMGFSDLGCYGSEIPTPNIDALAKNGMRFTQFYNTGRCCPSRASLMTGTYAHAVGMGAMNSQNLGSPGFLGRLSDQAITLPECLKLTGYQTYMVGKWHLSPTDSIKSQTMDGSWPLQRGFDEFYGTMEGAKDYYKPSYLYRNKEPQSTGEGYYYTHAISDSAATFIDRHSEGGPFFLYTAFYTPHFPLHAPKETVQKYRGQYKMGWDSLRQLRLRKQKEIHIIDEDTQLPKTDKGIPEWQSLSPEKQEEMEWRMAIYAAQIEELDKAVGKIINSLKANDQYDHTLIIFLSDNGAVGTSLYGRGKRENLNRSGPYTSYGKGWGQASNTPYRKYKAFNHEGGIISPLIICHQSLIPAGSINRQPAHIIDMLPTILNVVNADLPKQKNNSDVIPIEGRSLLPALKNPDYPLKERPLFWEHLGRKAVRWKNWKLVTLGSKEEWELYNLTLDPTELMDLSEEYPEKVQELTQLWQEWADQHQVLPMDKRNWNID